MKKFFLCAFLLISSGIGMLHAQTKDITGTVTNEKNENIIGASIKVKGSTLAAFTDDNGVFSLKGVADTAVIIISASGYQDHEINVADKTSFAITLIKNTTAAVVMALGYLNRSTLFFKQSNLEPAA